VIRTTAAAAAVVVVTKMENGDVHPQFELDAALPQS
jgi:hypothetical protein